MQPHWGAKLFLIGLFVCLAFIVLNRLEQKINPVGWDLGTLQKIHEMEKLTQQSRDGDE